MSDQGTSSGHISSHASAAPHTSVPFTPHPRGRRDRVERTFAQVHEPSRASAANSARLEELAAELTEAERQLHALPSGAHIRDEVRDYLIAVVDSSSPPPLTLPEHDGYWLPSAALTLSALLSGSRPAGEPDSPDPRRTALFLACALACTGRPDQAAEYLTAALGSADGHRLSRAQWELYLAAADGVFGSAGADAADAWLADVLRPVGDVDADRAWTVALQRAMPSYLERDASMSAHAASRLVRLRDHCLAAFPEDGAESTEAGEPPSALLNALVDEGTPEEAPLLHRIADLRHRIESRTPDADPPARFDDPLGSADRLLATAFADPDTEPAARARMLRLGLPQLQRTLAYLRDRLRTPAPDAFRVERYGLVIPVSSGGPDAARLADARRSIDESNRRRDPRGAAVGTGAFLAATAAISFTGFGWALIAGMGTAACAAAWVHIRRTNRDNLTAAESMREELDKAVASARSGLVEQQRATEKAHVTGGAAYDELSALFGRLGGGEREGTGEEPGGRDPR